MTMTNDPDEIEIGSITYNPELKRHTAWGTTEGAEAIRFDLRLDAKTNALDVRLDTDGNGTLETEIDVTPAGVAMRRDGMAVDATAHNEAAQRLLAQGVRYVSVGGNDYPMLRFDQITQLVNGCAQLARSAQGRAP